MDFKFRLYLEYIVCVILAITITACKKPLTPKPRAYFRIDFPEKQYETFESECNFTFEYPKYGVVNDVKLNTSEPCWYDIDFDDYNATIHLTYKTLNKKYLSAYVEDVRRIVYKHIIKADDIIETRINNPNRNIYGILYDIEGNAASSVNFYITDSTSGFLCGSLYFNTVPNKDSLAPAIQFFRKDIVHLIQSFTWE